jgi:hypothetical protein
LRVVRGSRAWHRAYATPRAGFAGTRGKRLTMPLDPNVKKNWAELQKKFNYPVNAIGVKISEKDQATLKVWKDEGIDKFLKK